MATRSRIGIENEDGTVSSIYCHWDGYVSNNGKILVTHYTDRQKVKELIELGDISTLAENVHPFEPMDNSDKGVRMLKEFRAIPESVHSFERPQKGVVIAYHRDRGETYTKPRVNEDLESYLVDDNEEYGYVFTLKGEWIVKPCYGNTETKPVIEYLEEEDAEKY